MNAFISLRGEIGITDGGTGLGLAIVKSCLEACPGSVAVRNREPHGLRVEIKLRAV